MRRRTNTKIIEIEGISYTLNTTTNDWWCFDKCWKICRERTKIKILKKRLAVED